MSEMTDSAIDVASQNDAAGGFIEEEKIGVASAAPILGENP